MNTKIIFISAILALAGCNRGEQTVSGPLKQRGYVWQREWTAAVADAVDKAARRMDGVVLLGAEINLSGKKNEVVRASIDWDTVKRESPHCSVALRISPYTGPFRNDDAAARTISGIVSELLDAARTHEVQLEEFQLDFDCSKKNLKAYKVWLRMIREMVHPTRFVITTLPAWLDDSEFSSVVREADGYVMQVHSVPLSNNREATLCDVRLARQWVTRAARLGIPFAVALPTYRCSAGYGPDGKLISVAMDSVQPVWPPGTGVLEFGSDPDDLAGLVSDWQSARPSELREILWYRVPIATDARNWRWVTLSAVMTGRRPEHKLNVVQEGENPVDLSIFNAGEADEQVTASVVASWSGAELVASDALTGWTIRPENGRAIFSANASRGLRMPPATSRKIGWLRFDRATNLRVELSNESESLR